MYMTKSQTRHLDAHALIAERCPVGPPACSDPLAWAGSGRAGDGRWHVTACHPDIPTHGNFSECANDSNFTHQRHAKTAHVPATDPRAVQDVIGARKISSMRE